MLLSPSRLQCKATIVGTVVSTAHIRCQGHELPMNRIVVTGGAGRLGHKVVELLIQRGYDVLAIDQVRPAKMICPFLTVDLTDAASVCDALKGTNTVIHLGAIPGPTSHHRTVTFQNNVVSTWNVADAVAPHDLQRLVFASSVFTLGWHESAERYWPEYVPVDEEHPPTPFEAYGLSKVLGEETVAMVSRQTGGAAVSLRTMNVIQEDAFRDIPWPAPTIEHPMRFVLWPYVHIHDAAMACCQALEADVSGHEAAFIAAKTIRFAADTADLLEQLARQVEIRKPLPGSASVISIEKAKRLIGFDPKF